MYEICTDFQNEYDMSKAEAKNFHEGFGHFLNIMTDVNPELLLNSLWLKEHFFEMWNNMEPQEMLEKCIEHSVQRKKESQDYFKKHPSEPKIINKEKGQ